MEIDNQLKDKFKQLGNEIIEISPEEKDIWRKQAIDGKVYDLVKDKMDNPEILDKVLQKQY